MLRRNFPRPEVPFTEEQFNQAAHLDHWWRTLSSTKYKVNRAVIDTMTKKADETSEMSVHLSVMAEQVEEYQGRINNLVGQTAEKDQVIEELEEEVLNQQIIHEQFVTGVLSTFNRLKRAHDNTSAIYAEAKEELGSFLGGLPIRRRLEPPEPETQE